MRDRKGKENNIRKPELIILSNLLIVYLLSYSFYFNNYISFFDLMSIDNDFND